jgi:hypothetical protein
MNTESNNVQALALLVNLLNTNDAYDQAFDGMTALYEARNKPLKALRDAGFKSVQSGKALRYNKDALPLVGEYSYLIATTEFEARLLAKNPMASKAQIDANNKQRVASLNFWLVNGKFTTNVGKDKARLEHEIAAEKFSDASLEALRIASTAKISARQALENKKLVDTSLKVISSTKATIERLKGKDDEISVNALKIVTAKAKLEQDNLATLKANLKTADKIANKAQAAKAKADKVAQDAKQAKDDKAQAALDKINKAQDMKKIANDLCNKYTTEQIEQLIEALQNVVDI